MEDFLFSVNVIFPVFTIIGIGYYFKRFSFVTKEFLTQANEFIFKCGFPFMSFINIYKADLSQVFDLKVVLCACVTSILMAVLSAVVYHFYTKDDRTRGAMVLCTFRSNFAIFGYYISGKLYGPTGVAVIAMIMAFFSPVSNAIAIFSSTYFGSKGQRPGYKKLLWDITKNPLIYGTILGLAANVVNLRLPAPVSDVFSQIGDCSTPIALLILGGQFEILSLAVNVRHLLFGTFMRLIVMPVLFLPAAVMLGIRGASLIFLMVVTGGPVGITNFPIAANSGIDEELTLKLIMVSSFFSVFTMFILIFTLRSFALI